MVEGLGGMEKGWEEVVECLRWEEGKMGEGRAVMYLATRMVMEWTGDCA